MIRQKPFTGDGRAPRAAGHAAGGKRGASFGNRDRRPMRSQINRSGALGKAVSQSPTAAPVTSNYTLSRDTLRIIPLGGVEEVGANMTVIEYGDDMIIVDMGLAFPDETTPGVDYIIPDTTWLQQHKHKIRAVLITHGHLDHIGAIPYLMQKLGNPPIYTMQLTAGFINKRLEEFDMVSRTKVNVVNKDETLSFGNFNIRFFRVNHNIPDCVGMSIRTPVGQIVYVTDWKFDHTPVDLRPTEFNKIAQFGGEGVMLLLSDSTNALKPGYCISERDIGITLDRIIGDAKARVIVATFSALLSRIQSIFDAAAKHNRKIVVTGRSMVNNIEIALSLGYLRIEPKLIIKSEQAKNYPDSQIIILTTGAQGEEASALARMSRGEHKTVRIKKGDTVIVSASPIPGNERSVVAVLDNLTREGAIVIYNKVLDIHSSGHAQQEELKLMFSMIKPKYFIPIHGEHHMLVAHGQLAQLMGLSEDQVFVLGNGESMEINARGEGKRGEKVQAGYVFVDGLGVGDVGEVVIRDRQVMAKDGMFVIIMTIDRKTGKLVSQPDILSRGFIYMKDNDELIREVKHEVRKMAEGSSGKNQPEFEANWSYLRQAIRDDIGEYLFQKTERRPMILPVIIEV